VNASPGDRDLVRKTLAVVFLLLLIGTTFWILRPLMPAILWSSAIVVSTWPNLIWLEQRLPGRRGVAAAVLTLLLVVLLLAPLFLGILAVLQHTEQVTDFVASLPTRTLPPPPAWIARIPLVGDRLAAAWQEIVAAGGEGLVARLTPYANDLLSWFITQLGGIGRVLMHFVFTAIGVIFLYLHGDKIGARVERFAVRLAGTEGKSAIQLAAQATRSVALGVLVTAIIQALLAGLGLWAAGVPGAGILTMLMIVTGLAHLGPVPILLGSTAWLFWQGHTAWAIALLVWTVFVSVIDNVLRPYFIRLGADLPMMLVFVGVLGGLIAFGVVGLFIGPVVLAVIYRMEEAWVTGEDPATTPGNSLSVPVAADRDAKAKPTPATARKR